MNDPHVEALIFRVEHGPTVNYGHARPLEFEQHHFGVHIDAETATFTMKTHYANADDALAVVMPFVHAWELNAGLKHGPEWFRLVYQRPEIVDRDPTPSDIRGDGILAASQARVHAGGVVTAKPTSYPEPALGLLVSPDVEVMYYRYQSYLQGRDLLGNTANFCLSVLESGVKGNQRSAASKAYRINIDVLKTLGALAAKKGGRNARKAKGIGKEFTVEEEQWIDATIKAIIRRAAEVAYDASQALPQITLKDLPSLDPAEDS